MNPERIYGTPPATDEDWASPRFDHLQPSIAEFEDPTRRFVGGRSWALAEAQRWRDARPYLVGNIRRGIGDPNWHPRGRVVPMKTRGTQS